MQTTKRMGPTMYVPYLLLAIFLMSSACRKNLREADSSFDAKAAKEWYYGVFKKSAEFKSSPEWGKKLPGWQFGIYRRVEGMEIVEFPLFRKKYKVSLDKSASKSESELRQLARSSLSRIVFIKKSDGSVFVRELIYVPSMSYLQQRNFDISDVHLGINNSGGFTGRVLIGKWDGTPVSVQVFKEGNISGMGKIRLAGSSSAETNGDASHGCELVEVCEYYRDCTDYYRNDVWIEKVCTDWQPTGFCWIEEVCEPDECDYSLAESCECQLYGLGCGKDDDDPELPCSYTDEEAAALLESVVVTEKYDFTSEVGAEVNDPSGIIIRPANEKWTFYNANFFYGFHVEFSAYFKGHHYRLENDPIWKWKTFEYSKTAQSGGSTPPCLSHDLTTTAISTSIDTDGRLARAVLSWAALVKISCVPSGWQIRSMDGGPMHASFDTSL